MLILLVGLGGPVFAEPTTKQVDVYFVPMHYVFDGKQLAPPADQQGFIYQGSTYVPMRFISYSLDKAVQWDGATNTVSISEPTKQDKSAIDTYKQDRVVNQSQQGDEVSAKLVSSGITVYQEKVNYIFDGDAKQPSASLPGFIYQDRLYVPMRFFAEAVGKKIDWDPKTYSVKAQTVSVSPDAEPGDAQISPTPTPTPEPTPTPTPAADGAQLGGGTPGAIPGGAGGTSGDTAKPTYDALKSAADAQILALKNTAQSSLLGLLSQYSPTMDAQAKADLKSQASAMLAGFDAQFAGILGGFQAQLTANGYSTSIIATYQQDYNDQKQLAQSLLGM